MSPRSEEFMAMARDRLAAARGAMQAGSPSGATSDAYYAVLNAARAALSEQDRYAKTHRGLWNLFRETFVETARFDRSLFEAASATQKLREETDYQAYFVPPEKAEETLALAERFIAAIDALFPS